MVYDRIRQPLSVGDIVMRYNELYIVEEVLASKSPRLKLRLATSCSSYVAPKHTLAREVVKLDQHAAIQYINSLS